MPRRKRVEETSSVFDITMGFSQLPAIVLELEKIKIKFERKITELEDVINQTKTEVANKFGSVKSEFLSQANGFLIELRNDIFSLLSKEAQKIESYKENAEKTFAHIQTITKGDKGDPGTPGKNGISPVADLIVKNVLKLIPLPKNGKDAIVNEKELIEIIIKKLLEKKLEIKDIKNLEETLRHLSYKTMLSGNGGGQGSWKRKILSGTVDGSNKIFTFAGDPPAEFSERVFLNYTEQNPFTDYTITGTTITYTTAPDASLSGLPHIIRYM